MKPVLIVQNWAAESPGTISEYLEEKGIPYQVCPLYENAPLPEPESSDRLIVLGCPYSMRDYREHEWLTRLFAHMAAAVRQDQPILGICFGAQMLAAILGAKVERNQRREIGIYDVALTEAGRSDPVFSGFPDRFPVFHWHGDTFRIPFGATHLATGADCPNQAFRKGRAVGVQFHLEPTAEEVPRWCDEYRQELSEEHKSPEEILAAFTQQAARLRELNFLLLDNFMAL